VQTCLLSAFVLMPSIELFKSLESCCVNVVKWPSWTPVDPGRGIDSDKYAQLFDAVNLLRDVRRYRPMPAGWKSLRSVLVRRFEEDGTSFTSAEQKYMHMFPHKSASGRPNLGRSGAARPSSAKGHRSGSAIRKHRGVEPDLHVTVGGDADGTVDKHKRTAMHLEPTVTAAGTEDVNADNDDDAASDVTIIASDVDIAEFKLNEPEQEMKARSDESPSNDMLSANDSAVDVSNRNVFIDSTAYLKMNQNHLQTENIVNEASDDISSSSLVHAAGMIQPSLQSQRAVDGKKSVKHRVRSFELEQRSEVSEMVERQLHESGENEPEAAGVTDERNSQSCGKDYLESETNVNKYVTALSPISVNRDMGTDDSNETQCMSSSTEDIMTSVDKAGCSETVLTTTAADSVSPQLSSRIELTNHSNDEAAVNVSHPTEISSGNHTNKSPQKQSQEPWREFQVCINHSTGHNEPETVVNQYATLSSSVSVSRNIDSDDSDDTRSLHCREDVVTSLDEAVKHLQQTSCISSRNDFPLKVSGETGQEFLSSVNDGTEVVIDEGNETGAANMSVTNNFGDSTLAECLGGTADTEMSNTVSATSNFESEAAITSHMETTARLKGEKIRFVGSMNKSDTSVPYTVKLSNDSVDVLMPRCFVSLYRIPTSSAGADSAGPETVCVDAPGELQRKCSVVLQRLSPSSLDLPLCSLTKSSAPTEPCTGEEDHMSVISLSSDEDEAPVHAVHDTECSSVLEQASAVVAQDYVHETVPEEISLTETAADHSDVAENELGERCESVAVSDTQIVQSSVAVSENNIQADKSPEKTESTELASYPRQDTDLNYYSDIAADVIDDISVSPATVVEDDEHNGDNSAAATVDSSLSVGSAEDQNTEAVGNMYSGPLYHCDMEVSEVVVTESNSVTVTLTNNMESLTVTTKHELVTEEESAVYSDVIESSVVVASDDDSQHAEDDVASVSEEANTSCGTVLGTAATEAQDGDPLSPSTADSSAVIDHEENSTAADNVGSSRLYSDVSKMDTVETDDGLSVLPSESITKPSDDCSQLCTKDVAVVASVSEEAKTFYGNGIDRAAVEARDGNLSSHLTVTANSPTMLDHEEIVTAIENEDSSMLCSDAVTVEMIDRLSVVASESIATTNSVGVVTDDKVESSALIDEVVSRGATYMSSCVSGGQSSQTEHLGNDPIADEQIICNENNDGGVVVCDPFPIFAEGGTQFDAVDNNVRPSTKMQNNAEVPGDSGITDRHIGGCEEEIREDACALIDLPDVPEPADEIYLCTTSSSMQSLSEPSEVDYDDDLVTDSKNSTVEQSADAVVVNIQNPAAAESNVDADLQDKLCNVLSGSTCNTLPVCSLSATTVDSTCTDSEQLKVDNYAADICSDNAEDHSAMSLTVADAETDIVRSELSILPAKYSSEDINTCRGPEGTQKSISISQEQPAHSEDNSAQLVNYKENLCTVKLGDSAHIDANSCTEDFTVSEQHTSICCENASASGDATHMEVTEENKTVLFKLDKLSAICKDVHKNVQQIDSELTLREDSPSVPAKPEQPGPLPTGTSNVSHIFYCPDCPLKFFSYTAFISHLRTENQGHLNSAAGTVTRPGTSWLSALIPAKAPCSVMKSLHKDIPSTSAVTSRRQMLSEPQKSDSTGSVDRSEMTVPVSAATLIQGSVGRTESQEAQLVSVEHLRHVPAKSRRSLPASTAPTHKSEKKKQGSVSSASCRLTKQNTSAAPTSTKSRRSLPESLHRSTVYASVGRSRKRKNSDSKVGTVGDLQTSAAVLSAVKTEGSVSTAAGLPPSTLHASELSVTSSAKSHHSLPRSRRGSSASASSGTSFSRKNTVSSTGKQQTQQVKMALSRPAKAESHRRLSKVSSVTGKSHKPSVSALDRPEPSSEICRGRQDVEKTLHRVPAKSRSSLQKSDSAATSATKSVSRKRSASQNTDRNVGNKQMKDDTAKCSHANSRRSLPKSGVCRRESLTSNPRSKSRNSMPL